MTDPVYKRVLKKITSRIGIPIADLAVEDFELLRSFIAERYREFIEAWKWIEEMRLEKRFFREGLWVAGTFAAGAIVFYDPSEGYFENTSGTPTTEEPTTGTDWETVVEFRRFIPFIQAGFPDKIKEVYNAWEADIRLKDRGAAREVQYELYTGDGLDFRPNAVDTPFIYYRIQPWDYMGELYDNTLTYAVGVELFDEETGEYYTTIATIAAGESPKSTPASWSLEQFNYRAENYVVRGVYADWLDQEEREKESLKWEGKATKSLDDERRKMYKQQSQLPKISIRTPQRPINGGLSDTVTSLSSV